MLCLQSSRYRVPGTRIQHGACLVAIDIRAVLLPSRRVGQHKAHQLRTQVGFDITIPTALSTIFLTTAAAYCSDKDATLPRVQVLPVLLGLCVFWSVCSSLRPSPWEGESPSSSSCSFFATPLYQTGAAVFASPLGFHPCLVATALSPSDTPRRHRRVQQLVFFFFFFFSSSLFFTSFSPIRISGHILCSFSQVSHPSHRHSSLVVQHTHTDAVAALESLPVPHIAKV